MHTLHMFEPIATQTSQKQINSLIRNFSLFQCWNLETSKVDLIMELQYRLGQVQQAACPSETLILFSLFSWNKFFHCQLIQPPFNVAGFQSLLEVSLKWKETCKPRNIEGEKKWKTMPNEIAPFCKAVNIVKYSVRQESSRNSFYSQQDQHNCSSNNSLPECSEI